MRAFFNHQLMKKLAAIFCVALLCSCASQTEKTVAVSGKIAVSGMGISLIHEHLLVDFIGADSTGYHRWRRDSVIARVLPYLNEAKSRGVQTFVDCTPAYLGRDPQLLKALSELSGLNILTNTGYYGAVNNKYLPPHAFYESAEQLAARWIAEFTNGIEDSGVRPGFIKISVNGATPLSDVHQKLVKAAALTHLSTGLSIASHTGPAAPAMEEIAILEAAGVHPSAFIWVHAQAESDYSWYKKAAEKGAWISLDGVAWDVAAHLDRLAYCKENGLLSNILISHDAGWYSPGEKGGGEFRGFTTIFDQLIPELRRKGFSEEDIRLLLVNNPARAFSISVKKY